MTNRAFDNARVWRLGADVDTASYANLRRFLNSGSRPPAGAVRIDREDGQALLGAALVERLADDRAMARHAGMADRRDDHSVDAREDHGRFSRSGDCPPSRSGACG